MDPVFQSIFVTMEMELSMDGNDQSKIKRSKLTLKLRSNSRLLILIWLGWAVILSAFQFWVTQRIDLTGPDNVLRWTASESNQEVRLGKQYLLEPFLNEHVAWDSEYYLSIAMGGYDDPEIRGVPQTGDKGYYTNFCAVGGSPRCVSLSYAFFPLYPLLMRFLAPVLSFIPISAIARFTLAGVLISLLGTLGAMFSLRHLMGPDAEEADGLRAVFYLLGLPWQCLPGAGVLRRPVHRADIWSAGLPEGSQMAA